MAKNKKPITKPTRKNDKIFNSYNHAGDHEFDAFRSEIKIDTGYKAQFDEETKYNTYQVQKLRDNILEIFEASKLKEIYKESRKKVPKNQVFSIYYYFKERIRDKDALPEMKIFIEIADFMKINYKVLYDELSPLDKEKIIKDLDDTFHMLKNKNDRLF